MSTAFDPYYKWLGIRPEEQPANHYRLLGIALFESDLDVIDSAADQRMTHLRSFQTGRHGPLSQRLLSEISAARVCLLDPQRKAAYDDQLQRQLATAAQPKSPSTSSLPEVAMPGLTISPLGTRPSVRKRTSGLTMLIAIGTIAAVLMLLGVGVAIVTFGNRPPMVAKQSQLRPSSASELPPPKLPPSAPSSGASASRSPPDAPPPKQESSQPGSSNLPAETVQQGDTGTIAPTLPPNAELTQQHKVENPPPAIGTESGQSNIQPETSSPDTPRPFSPNDRVPVPSNDAQEDANKRIREAFGRDLATASTTPQKQDLAAKLLKTARETESDLPGQFVLLRLASEFATEAGDATLALDLVDQIAAVFQIDDWKMKSDTVTALGKQAQTPVQHRELLDRLMPLMEDAASVDRFDIARDVGQVAIDSASKVRDPVVLKQVRQRVTDIEVLAKGFADTTAARAALANDPNSAEANHKVGTYLCLLKNDWNNGLPLLAKGSDPSLKGLAQRDLDDPAEIDEQVKLGDEWWNLGQKKSAVAKKQLQARATHWYKAALPGLVGSTKERLLDRIASAMPVTRIDFKSPQALGQFVLAEAPGRTWKIKGGSLYISGDAAYATLRTHYKSISSVTIRGGIESPEGRNFRVSVGPVNMILNWEGANQNHFRLGENAPPATVTEPRVLVPAKLQEIQILQEGENAVVTVNGKREYSVPTTLEGTLTIYPYGSTIIVQEIIIAGEADPAKSVTEPSHKNLY